MADRLHSFTLGDVAREGRRALPDTVALVCGSSRFTFPQFDDRINQLAQLLSTRGVSAGDRVVWLGLNCHRLVELIYACAKLGAIAAPLNWRLSSEELRWTLVRTSPRVVIGSTRREVAEAQDISREIVPSASWLTHDDGSLDTAMASEAPLDPELDVDDERPVLQLMTAAFDGHPKGALLTSRGIVQQSLVLAAVGVVKPGDEVYLASGPMFHIGVLLKVFALLQWGGTTVVAPRVDAQHLAELVTSERCTSAYLFAPTIRDLVALNADGRYNLGSLADIGGGSPPADVSDAWYAMTSCKPPKGSGLVGYGTTETVGMVTFEGRLPASVSAFGRSSPAMALRIVDPEGREASDGEVGEIIVRGPQIMAGYLHEPALNSQGWRWTGDLGRRESDGGVSFLGPNIDLIKTGHENVYPAEVEHSLKRHPAVREACVFGVPDPDWGQAVVAVVETSDGVTIEENDLIDHVRHLIASYKKPKRIIIVDSLPRNGALVDRDAVKSTHGGAWNVAP